MLKNIEIHNTINEFNSIKQRANKMFRDGLIKAVEDTHNGIRITCFSVTDKRYLEADFNL